MRTERDRAIALAGAFQSARLVDEVAHGGAARPEALEASLFSLFQLDPESVEAVYGGIGGVRSGLECLRQQLAGGAGRSLQVTRYVLSMMHLERKAMRDGTLVEVLRRGLAENLPRLEHFPVAHPNILAGLADLYSRTIGTLQPRIMVQGEPLYLRNQDNVHTIRALLLAGIRSVLLWRQSGGNRLQVLLGRRRLLARCEALLSELA